MRHSSLRRIGTALLLLMIGIFGFGHAGIANASQGTTGAVFALTNAAAGNAVAMFARTSDGRLMAAGSILTGGLGTGSGLGSQGALVFGKAGRYLYAVNAGSDDISVFRVRQAALTLVQRVPSGGDMPISLTTHDDTLVVLNAGGAGTIVGFQIGDGGMLRPLADATRTLSQAGAGPAQVQFNADGDLLAVTEKATNRIDIYRIADDGTLSEALTHPSAGQTPFGFAFDRDNHLIVSEAFGGGAGAGAVSAYSVEEDRTLQVLTPSLPNQQSAPCWVALGKNERYAYVSNTGSGTVSAYRVGDEGTLTLLQANGIAATTGIGSAPADIAVSTNGRFAYVRNGGTGTIAGFHIQPDGTLRALGATGALPSGAAGLAVR